MNEFPVLLSTEWLSNHMDDPNLRIVDVTPLIKKQKNSKFVAISGREAFDEGHIPGAIYVDIEKELSDPNGKLPFTLPSRDQFIETITELGIGNGTNVVIYQQNPVPASYWASRLWWHLRFEGFENVAVLDGGLLKWQDEGKTISTEIVTYPKKTFTGHRKQYLRASAEKVKQVLNDGNYVLIHSLSSAEFRGETNSFLRPGHIPGSKNVFYGQHIDEKTNNILDDEILKRTFKPIGALDSNKKVITYCGRGISATWNALLLEKIGIKDVAVYDGSLAEWSADPSLPLE